MNPLVKIKGSTQFWKITEDDGETVTLAAYWYSASPVVKTVKRSRIAAQWDYDNGWVRS